ncbi:MAG: EthD domain-containing protein [Gammaproteobacteria bacterium]|nr:EthD domain-containing protein [Gammaproteobacteria bacterium]
MTDARPKQTPGAKMQYLIKRRAGTSREELIAHWYANHMPGVIARNAQNRAAGRPHARHYVASLFNPEGDAPQAWDGVAQLWYDAPLPRPAQASGVEPYDTFQQKVEPYWPWATHEWVVVDGKLPLEPLTLNAPFPCTRSGFLKQVSLVAAKPGADVRALCDHWLDVHLPNVRDTMLAVGGFRYAVSLSIHPDQAPYAGMAELYFPDRAAQDAFWAALEPDGFQEWVDAERTLRYRCGTEMIGIE